MSGGALLAAMPATGLGSGLRAPSLAREAEAAGRFYGIAARIDQIESEPGLADIVRRECNCLTHEIDLKWNVVQPGPAHFHFAPADGLVRFAAAHGLAVRGHTLLWEQSTPGWALGALRRRRDWSIVADHFAALLPRYGERIAEWDVVNEPVDSEAGEDGYRRTVFHRAFGPGHVARALREARRHLPRARLMINDYGFDYDNPVEARRRDIMLRMVERLRREGAPLDGVGVQAHLDLSKGPFRPAILRDFLSALAGLGVSITITELDVREHDFAAPIDLRDRRVADEVSAYLNVALAEPAVRGIVTWGLSDRHSWLQEQRPDHVTGDSGPALNRGLPYDADLAPKPLYWAMHRALAGTA